MIEKVEQQEKHPLSLLLKCRICHCACPDPTQYIILYHSSIEYIDARQKTMATSCTSHVIAAVPRCMARSGTSCSALKGLGFRLGFRV